MAIFPNPDCYLLCVWMTDIALKPLTGPQTTLTNIVKAAALAQTSVTDQQWHDFNLYASWRNPFYIVYRDYQYPNGVDLNDSLQNFYNFEGNSNDSVGSINGTDTGITYSTLYGKIGQGARAANGASKIVLGANTDFTFIQNTGIFSINFWFKNLNTTGGYYPLGSVSSFASKGIWFQMVNSDLTRFVLLTGTGTSVNSPLVYTANTLLDSAYHMYTLIGDGSFIYLYKDSDLRLKGVIPSFASGNSTNALQLFNIPSLSGSAESYIDLLGIWTRALNIAEIATLYNSGAGLAYPF